MTTQHFLGSYNKVVEEKIILKNKFKEGNLQNKKRIERNYGIDILRLFSTFMIVNLHFITKGGVIRNCKKFSFSFHLIWFFKTLCYSGVDIFGLISGYVMIYLKINIFNIIPLYLNFYFYSSIITLLFKYIPYLSKIYKVSNYAMVLNIIFPITSGRYWYLSSYFCMYIFIPYINIFIHSLNKKEIQKLCLSIIIISSMDCISPGKFDPFSIKRGLSPIWLISLYIFGAYLKIYPFNFSNKKLFLFYNIAIIIPWISLFNFITTFIGKYKYDNYILYRYNSPFILLNSVVLVSFFSKLKIHHQIFKKIIKIFALLSVNVYLIHNHSIIGQSYKNHFKYLSKKNPFIMVLLSIIYSIVIFFSCYIIDLVRYFLFKLLKVSEIPKKIEKLFKNN